MGKDIAQLRLIAAPEALLDQDGWRVWHSGITDGPHGLETVVDILDTSGQERIRGPLWEMPDRPRPPIEVTAQTGDDELVHPSVSEYISPDAGQLHVKFGRFGRRLGPRPDDGPIQLTIHVHAVGIRIDRVLDGPGNGAPMAAGQPRPRLLAAPRLLHEADRWVLWHSGVVDDPRAVRATFEILDTTGRDRVIGPRWDIPAFGPTPVDVTVTHAGTQLSAVVALGSTPGSYRVITSFPHPAADIDPSSLQYSITVAPLNLHLTFSIADA